MFLEILVKNFGIETCKFKTLKGKIFHLKHSGLKHIIKNLFS